VEDLENEIVDAETGVSLFRLGLARKENKHGKLIIYYRPPSPFTPVILVIKIGLDIKFKYPEAIVILEDYYISNEINKILNGIKIE